MKTLNSRLPGFYKQTLEQRIATISSTCDLHDEEISALTGISGFSVTNADHMIENSVGIFSLPFGIGTNFLINNRDYLIPMVIEEPSVVAAVSNAAKLFREGGGFLTKSDPSVMIGQIQIVDIQNIDLVAAHITDSKEHLLALANETAGSILSRGGGSRDLHVRLFRDTEIGDMIVVHLLFDVQDAMGANAVNTAVEYIAPHLEEISGGRVNLRILSNLTDQRKVYAEGVVPSTLLERNGISADQAVQSIVEAGIFAEIDPYRAATHNKGIMNGIDAVVIATGNDWRAVEAGAHAFAARSGSYSSLTKWRKDHQGNLHGSIELPLAVGTVGGATKVHPTAQIAMKILGYPNARELAEVMAAVGLAQNFAAIRALATEGIQRGHMRMHAKQLAVAAGATSDEIPQVVEMLVAEGNIRLQRAKEIVSNLQQDKGK
jgi:hydroxymethylglutaryl-CoA reductase